MTMTLTKTGVQYQDVKESSGPILKPGQRIRLNYRIALSEPDLHAGRLIDNSEIHDPLIVHLGTGELLRGVEEGLQNMRVGGTRLLVIPSELAFGERGIPGRVPVSADLYVEINVSTKTDA